MYQIVKERPGRPIVDACTRDDFTEIGRCGDYIGVVVSTCGHCWDCHAIKADSEQLHTKEVLASEVRAEDDLVFPQEDGRVEVFRVKEIDAFPGRFNPELDFDTEAKAHWLRFQCHGGPVVARDMDNMVQVIVK
ncbi:hypothetical protein [Streptomyces atratus]|uniref:hypothetical protein n=1 Tax=Streptomyces atratus TaxID=1893 RepID=UPI0036680B0F